MPFNRIVWKMVKADFRKYLFYFSCNTLAVALFFLYASIFYNADVDREKQFESINYTLAVPGIALIVFIVFFVSQAHQLFIKRRKAEFGLFRTLGMTNRDVSRLLVLENLFVGILSIVAGLLAGVLFSRMFFYLMSKILGIEAVSFGLNSQMFSATIYAYAAVFTVAVCTSLYQILKKNLVDSLKSDRTAEHIALQSPLLGWIGVTVLAGSIIGLYVTYTGPNGGDYLILWTIFAFCGLYFCLSQFSDVVLQAIKRDEKLFYKHILSVSSLDYKFRQLTSTLMLITVMIMITVLYGTMILYTYQDAAQKVEDDHPYDLAFLEADGNNPQELLQEVLGNEVQTHDRLPVFTFAQQDPIAGWMNTYHLVSVEEYSRLTGDSVQLEDDEYVHHINQQLSDPLENYDFTITFPDIEGIEPYQLAETITEQDFNQLGSEFILVNQQEYDELKGKRKGIEGTLHYVNLNDWESSYDPITNLERSFDLTNKGNPSPIDGVRHEQLFHLSSKMEASVINEQTNGISFFVTAFLSVLFLIGSFVILYLNLFSGIEKEKRKFEHLHRIGLTTPEMKKAITTELIPIFFIPSITGITVALLFIIAISTDIGGILQNPEVITYFLIIALLYQSIQLVFYLYARKRMVTELM
ncbi:FtsX-like permease family protein [Jeotgalibacillus sp. R-1-5s-1]|uniref:FtsX-like permease family protein n=1 Tax=Jeotgalibacillus sp. R-1-5s-1 TaxID=2555897 RepID=UPI00106DA096|nr:ABC transporter permease [Jeotgalibacillus sp. R-1-5s-1]TFD94414.1 ABC transporter permease [Jeotgalibacillus sp. R-1-5s-1]